MEGESDTWRGLQRPNSAGVTAHAVTPSTSAPQRDQTYGVVVVTARNPDRSRIGRDMSVQSEWIQLRAAAPRAGEARAATSAR